jgi:DNA-directed RNA polymerase subunit RPC12/RpoP
VSERRIRCYRCGAEIDATQFDQADWAVIHAFEDGEALNVCPECQSKRESEMVDELR